MKKILFLHILFCISIACCNAQMYSTSHYIQQRPGFSNYSSQQQIGYNNDRRIGYTTSYSPVYNSYEWFEYSKQYHDDYLNNLSYRSNPYDTKRGINDHEEGSETVWVDGYSATVSWAVDANVFGWRWWTITVGGESQSYWGSKESAIAKATELAREEAREQAEKLASNPLDPYGDPIGDVPLFLFTLMSIWYCYYRKRKTVSA